MLPEDLKTLEQKGISPEAFNAQIKRFETGFPYLRILDSARVGCGIILSLIHISEPTRPY